MRMRIAASWFSRAKGLLLDEEVPADDEVLLLAPCRDIHTVGMRYPLDVAFLDESGVVRMTYEGLEPGRRLFCEEAIVVLERPSHPGGSWFSVGQRLELACAGGGVSS